MRSIIKFFLKQPRIHRYLRQVYKETLMQQPEEVVNTSVSESLPLACRDTELNDHSSFRLNLLVPALSQEHIFGGIATALSLFHTLRENYRDARIILTDQQSFCHADNPSYTNWIIKSLEDEDIDGLVIIPAGDRHAKALPISARDRFIATAWWTAYIAKNIQNWQHSRYSLPTSSPYIYLIQDFEPGFYPWSSRYMMAEATYSNPGNTAAVFNTSTLKRFFENEGYHFENAFVFEPHLNEELRARRLQAMQQEREKRVLIYGRPNVDRNAFEVIIMALRVWTAHSQESLDWEFISVGELHPVIELSNGKKLISKGKLSLEEYASEMGKAFLGISLMISPHPSYPPLEMAAFGVRVITNKYKNKDLSEFSDGIVSISSVSPETVVQALTQLTQQFAREPQHHHDENPTLVKYLLPGSSFETLAQSLLKKVA